MITRLSSQINEPGRISVNRSAAPAGILSNWLTSQAFRTEIPQATGARSVMTEAWGGRYTRTDVLRFPQNGTFQSLTDPCQRHSPFIYDDLAGADEMSHCGRRVCPGPGKKYEGPAKNDGAQAGSGLG